MGREVNEVARKKQKQAAKAAGTVTKKMIDDGMAVEAAIEEIQTRIDLIGRDYADDPGLMGYRRALILAVEALRNQLPGGS